MFTALLKMLLFLFLAFVVTMAVFVFGAVSQFRRATKRFREQFSDIEEPGAGGTRSNSQGASTQAGTQATRQKIIPQDEGEYVDFQDL